MNDLFSPTDNDQTALQSAHKSSFTQFIYTQNYYFNDELLTIFIYHKHGSKNTQKRKNNKYDITRE